MKKTLLIGGLLTTALFVNAQTRLVLYEEFSGENCAPCAATNPGLMTLLNTGTNPQKVMLIKYQSPIPTAGPIYYQNSGVVDNRISYYAVPFAPYARMDGAVSPGATSSQNAGHPGFLTQAFLDAETAIAAPFNITVNNTVSGSNISSTINVSAVAAYTGTTVKLRAAIVEDLSYATPPGTNGEMEFHHVVRQMYPSADGQTIPSTWTNGQTGTYTFTGTIPSYVDRTHNVFVVVWIQNEGDKKVAQAAKSTNLPPAGLDGNITISSPSNGTLLCGAQTPAHKVILKNTGSTTLTSANIYYKVGAAAYQSFPWTGFLAANATTEVNLGTLTLSGSVQITDSLGTINAVADENPANNVTQSSVAVLSTAGALPVSTGFESGLPANYMILDKNDKVVANPIFNADTWFTHTESAIKGVGGSLYTCIASAPNMEIGGTTIVTFPYTSAPSGAKAVDFYYSYAQRGTITGDKLELVASTDCGQNWTSIWNKSSADLATAAAVSSTSLFFPTSDADWKMASVDVSSISGNALVGFRATSNQGNLIFIDNVAFRTGNATGIEEVITGGNVNLYPNPVSNELNIDLNIVKNSKVSFTINNVVGQQVGSSVVKTLNAGQNKTTISTANLAAGIYMLNIQTEKGNLQQKFVKD